MENGNSNKRKLKEKQRKQNRGLIKHQKKIKKGEQQI